MDNCIFVYFLSTLEINFVQTRAKWTHFTSNQLSALGISNLISNQNMVSFLRFHTQCFTHSPTRDVVNVLSMWVSAKQLLNSDKFCAIIASWCGCVESIGRSWFSILTPSGAWGGKREKSTWPRVSCFEVSAASDECRLTRFSLGVGRCSSITLLFGSLQKKRL